MYNLKQIIDLISYNYTIKNSSYYNETVNITFYLASNVRNIKSLEENISLEFKLKKNPYILYNQKCITILISKIGFTNTMFKNNLINIIKKVENQTIISQITIRKIIISTTYSKGFKLDLKKKPN